MTVAFLSYYSGDIYRGGERYVHELANNLHLLGLDVQVYQHGKAIENSRYETINISGINDLSKLDKNIDILIPNNGRLQVYLSRLWTKFYGKKLIISGQSGPGVDERMNLYSFPDRFIALSKFQLKWAKKINPLVKSLVIPNGVDLNIFNPKAKPMTIDLPHPIVLNVAALVPLKRQELLIRAIADTPYSLLLVGKGPDYKKLTILGQKYLSKRFKIMDFSFAQMPSVYTSCDLFSFPTSPWESFGIAIVEAMSCNLPIVASDDPIRREIVGPAGICINPLDTKLYTQALITAFNTNWNNLPRNQSEKYSWSKIASSYNQLFKQIN